MKSNLKLDFLGGWASRIMVWFSVLKGCGGSRFPLETKSSHSSSLQWGEVPGQRSSFLHTVREFHQLQLTQNVLFSDAGLGMKTGFLLQENLRYSCSSKFKILFSHAMQHNFLRITKIRLFCLISKYSVKKRFLQDTSTSPQMTASTARTALPCWVPHLL